MTLLVHLEVFLTEKHIRTGRTQHITFGEVVGTPSKLKICSYEGDNGFYLLHLSKKGAELTDTYHDTIKEAQEQAAWEFDIDAAEWEMPK